MKCESKFYTFTAESEKPIILLLKRLNNSYSGNEVFQKLRSLRINEVEFNKITRFTTKFKKKELELCLFLLYRSCKVQ